MSLEALAQEMTARRPWTKAEGESIWNINGCTPGPRGTAFTDCLAVVLPEYVTGGPVLFKMIGALDDLISPDWITSAKELMLVHVDDTRSAYYSDDQKIIDQEAAS
jgi:hypothetical protein